MEHAMEIDDLGVPLLQETLESGWVPIHRPPKSVVTTVRLTSSSPRPMATVQSLAVAPRCPGSHRRSSFLHETWSLISRVFHRHLLGDSVQQTRADSEVVKDVSM